MSVFGILWMTLCSTLAFSQPAGFLKANGKVIVDGSGKTFILRGMGLGGWMLQEGYMLRVGNIGQQHRIREKIAALIGEERTAQFYNDWLKDHTTKRDVDSMAAWDKSSVEFEDHIQRR